MTDYGFNLTDKHAPARPHAPLEVDPDEKIALLPDMEDDPRWRRRRESGIISLIVHIAAVTFLLLLPKIFPPSVIELKDQGKGKLNMTYLATPPEPYRAPPAPPPQLPKQDLAQLRAPVNAPPVPMPSAPPAPTPSPLPAMPQPSSPPAQGNPNSTLPTAPSTTGSGEIKLSSPTVDVPKLPVPPAAAAGQSLESTLRGIAHDRANGGGGVVQFDPGTLGRGAAAGPAQLGGAQILTDTQGVDFNPYLQRMLFEIRRNWYAVMPEIARMGKRGKVEIQFEIERNGTVPRLFLTGSSQSEPLDKAAMSGIFASSPFAPLPPEFKGPVVRLKITFLYNIPVQ